MEKIVTVHPKKYDDAKTIGQAFRNGVPVIINLSNLPEVEAKRIIDFASGLVFGLQGKIKSVAASVFLLSPHNIAVGDEYDAISAKDDTAFYNQT
jgi:cell division inhibitor SepF